MQSAADYLDKTKSATLKLFEGIQAYRQILPAQPSFVNSYIDDPDLDAQVSSWIQRTKGDHQAFADSLHEYLAESFAQSTLSGAILQIAAKAIELHNGQPEHSISFIKADTKALPFCRGRLVRTLPIGLIIYAGR